MVKEDLTTDSKRTPGLFQRLGTRLFFSHFTAIFVAIGIVSFALLSLMRGYFIDALSESLYVQAELITRSMIPGATTGYAEGNMPAAFNAVQEQQLGQINVQVQSQADLREALQTNQELGALEQASVQINSTLRTSTYLFGSDGSPISVPEEGMEYVREIEPALQAALQGRRQRAQIRGEIGQALMTASPVMIQDEISGALVLVHPLRDLEEIFVNMWLRIGLAALVSLFFSGILSLFFARNLQRPVQNLTNAADKLVQGDFDHPVSTDRKDELGELSRSFKLMRDRLQETERLRTQFLGDIAHELRTPLTAIKSLIETLRDGAVEDERVRDRFLESIERETDRLVRLTRDVLLLTRGDQKGPRLLRRQVNLVDLVERIYRDYGPHAEKVGVKLVCDLPDGAMTVSLDSDRIEQVLINLFDNALRYAPAGSPVALTLRPIDAKQLAGMDGLHLSVRNIPGTGDKRWAFVEIRDQGPGIPPDQIERVYERFYRPSKARDRESGGSGLGIPIAKVLVEAHGGLFWLASPATKDPEGPPGTAACFALPLSKLR